MKRECVNVVITPEIVNCCQCTDAGYNICLKVALLTFDDLYYFRALKDTIHTAVNIYNSLNYFIKQLFENPCIGVFF